MGEKMILSKRRLLMIASLLFILSSPFFSSSLRAELIFNILFGDAERDSRDASSSILLATSTMLEALSHIEIRDYKKASDTLVLADRRINDAVEKLRRLAQSGPLSKDGRQYHLTVLSAQRQEAISSAFSNRKLAVPKNDAEMIRLALTEVTQLHSVFRENKPAFQGNDFRAAQIILASINRVLFLGTLSSELAKTAK